MRGCDARLTRPVPVHFIVMAGLGSLPSGGSRSDATRGRIQDLRASGWKRRRRSPASQTRCSWIIGTSPRMTIMENNRVTHLRLPRRDCVLRRGFGLSN